MDEEEIFRDRHLDYFMQLGIRGKDELVGPDQISWMDYLDKELDNIRTAMNWAIESDVEAGLRLITTTWRFWAHGHAREGEAWLSQFLTQADGVEPSIRAKALWVQGRFNYYSLLNDDLAQRLVEESLTLYRELGNQQGVGRCLGLLGFEAGSTNLSHFLEGLTLLKAEGDKLGVAEVLLRLGYAVWKDDYGQAMAYLEESKSLYREVGHLAGIADVLGNYGAIAIWRGDNESARSKLEESLDLRESLGLRGSTNSLT